MPAGTIILGVNSLLVWRVLVQEVFAVFLQTEESTADKGSEAQAHLPAPYTVSHGSPPALSPAPGARQAGRDHLVEREVPRSRVGQAAELMRSPRGLWCPNLGLWGRIPHGDESLFCQDGRPSPRCQLPAHFPSLHI